MTNWWEVSAAWAGAAGSFAAVAVALYIAVRGWRDAASREIRAQAQLVYCYTSLERLDDARFPGAVPAFVVVNGSDQPVFGVRIADRKAGLPLIPAHNVQLEAMSSAEARELWVRHVWLSGAVSGGDLLL